VVCWIHVVVPSSHGFDGSFSNSNLGGSTFCWLGGMGVVGPCGSGDDGHHGLGSLDYDLWDFVLVWLV
jgi:hypothetical protein